MCLFITLSVSRQVVDGMWGPSVERFFHYEIVLTHYGAVLLLTSLIRSGLVLEQSGRKS